ncbi:hypothetical protein V6N13_007712 [Hibiscus sabdariffa]
MDHKQIGPLLSHCPNVAAVDAQRVIVAAMEANGEWDWSKFQHLLSRHILFLIAVIQSLVASFLGDLVVWARNKLSRFTVKSAYKVRCEIEAVLEEDVWSIIDKF